MAARLQENMIAYIASYLNFPENMSTSEPEEQFVIEIFVDETDTSDIVEP